MLTLAEWKAASDQGRTVRAHGGLGNAFLSRGSGLRDAEFRFALRARLNLACTRAVLLRMHQLRNAVYHNFGCTHSKTLPHVINHCPGNEVIVRGRHDNIIRLVRNATRPIIERSIGSLEVTFDKHVAEVAVLAFKLNIQMYSHTTKTACISDLSDSFNDQSSDDPATSNLAFAYEHKVRKYAPLTCHLERAGWQVYLSAIVFDSPDSGHTRNYNIRTKQLSLYKRTAN